MNNSVQVNPFDNGVNYSTLPVWKRSPVERGQNMEGTMVEQAGMRQLTPQERRRVEQIDQRLDKALQAALDANPELRRQFERTYRAPQAQF